MGSLDVYNHELAQYAAVICSEVIEHLPEEILCQFGDMVRVCFICCPDLNLTSSPVGRYRSVIQAKRTFCLTTVEATIPSL